MAEQVVLRDDLEALQTFAGLDAAALRRAVADRLGGVTPDSVNIHSVYLEKVGGDLKSVAVGYTLR